MFPDQSWKAGVHTTWAAVVVVVAFLAFVYGLVALLH